jgi:hypothetical protein
MAEFVTPGVLVGRGTDLARLRDEFEKSSPFAAFEYVPVTFLAADSDLDVIHHLSPLTPEQIDYQIVRKDRACDVYHDTSGTRRAWGRGFITVRCDTQDAVVTLLLTIRRT